MPSGLPFSQPTCLYGPPIAGWHAHIILGTYPGFCSAEAAPVPRRLRPYRHQYGTDGLPRLVIGGTILFVPSALMGLGSLKGS